MGSFYLTRYSSALLVVILVGAVTLSFLVVNRDRSRHSRMLTYYMAALLFYNFMHFCGTTFYTHYAGYAYYGARIILVAMIFFLAFLYGFPKNLHPKESKIVIPFFLIIISIGLYLGISAGIQSEIIYNFEQMEFHPFIPGNIDSFMAIVVLVQYLWIIILCLRKAPHFAGRDRRALVAFAAATTIPLLLSVYSAITLSKAFSTEFNTFLFTMGMILSYYTYLISYVNNLKKSASFIFKLVALSLVTTLIFFAGFTAMRDSEIEDAYADRKNAELEKLHYGILTGTRLLFPSDLAYLKISEGIEKNHFIHLHKNYAEYAPVKKTIVFQGLDRYYHDAKDPWSFILLRKIKIKTIEYEAGFFYKNYREFIHERYAPMALITLLALLVIAVVYPMFFRLALLNPMMNLLSGVREVNRGHLDVKVTPEFHDEIGYLTRSFNRMIISIRRGIVQKTNNILYERNLEIARQIQRSLMPDSKPKLRGMHVAVRYLPADKIGGDFYDFHMMPGSDTLVMLADVSGHGVPAATLSGMVKISFQTEAAISDQPGNVIKGMNDRLGGRMGRQFVTVGLAGIDHENKILKYASGGHPPLLLLNRISGSLKELHAEGGIIGPFPEMEFPCFSEKISPGDRLILYSDGLTEVMNEEDELFGTRRLKILLQEIAGEEIEEFTERILTEQKIYSNPNSELYRHPDDITLVVLDFEEEFFKR